MACIHIYFGNQKCGKTMAMVNDAMKVAYEPHALRGCYNSIDKYNSMGYKFSKPKHLICADFDIEIHHYGKQPDNNYFVDGFYLGLPHMVVKKNKITYRTMLLPPGMKIFLDEGNKYFDSRNQDIMPGWRKRFIELMMHFDYELTMCCHRPMLVDACVRDLADFTQFYKKADIVYDYFGHPAKVILHARYFPTSDDVMAFIKTGVITPNVELRDIEIDCTLPCNNIPTYYDCKFFDKLFLRGAENRDFDLVKVKHECTRIEDVEKFNKRFDYHVPEGIYEKGVFG